MKLRKIVWGSALAAAVLTIGLAAPAEAQSKSIQIKGSDTMVNLGQSWAEAFNRKHPGVNIAVTGGGSGTGLTALIGGTCDIAESSRSIEPKEIEKAKSKGIAPKEFLVALDGIAIVVHPKNPVKNLTAEARGIKNMRFATTTTTTTTLAKHVEDIVPLDIQLACNIDSDCAQVNADCCGCNAGGEGYSYSR